MRLTTSQRELIEKAQAVEPAGRMRLTMIHADYVAGVRTVCRKLTADSAKSESGPRIVRVVADSAFGTVDALAYLAGRKTSSYSRTLCETLKTLSGEAKRPVTILLDRAHMMKPAEMERMAAHLDWAAEHSGVAVQCFFIFKVAEFWRETINAAGKQQYCPVTDWPDLPKAFRERGLAGELGILEFKRTELDELRKGDVVREVERRSNIIEARAIPA